MYVRAFSKSVKKLTATDTHFENIYKSTYLHLGCRIEENRHSILCTVYGLRELEKRKRCRSCASQMEKKQKRRGLRAPYEVNHTVFLACISVIFGCIATAKVYLTDDSSATESRVAVIAAVPLQLKCAKCAGRGKSDCFGLSGQRPLKVKRRASESWPFRSPVWLIH